jgi:hypothetical protein
MNKSPVAHPPHMRREQKKVMIIIETIDKALKRPKNRGNTLQTNKKTQFIKIPQGTAYKAEEAIGNSCEMIHAIDIGTIDAGTPLNFGVINE